MYIASELCRAPLEEKPHLSMTGIGVHHRGQARYLIEGLWCLHFYRYEGELRVDGKSFPIRPGYASLTPPDAVLEYSYNWEPSVHAVAHFALKPRGGTVPIPMMQDLGDDFEALCGSFEQVLEWRVTYPARAAARVWEVLWQLFDYGTRRRAEETTPQQHPAIEKALRLIETNLQKPPTVQALAFQVGLSHNHLTRLFNAATGNTPAAYIRRRRVELAAHLLRHTTQPIKAIAHQAGFRDLQVFNKVIRQELSLPPRAVRRQRKNRK